MSQQRQLNSVLDVLQPLAIDYVLTGSWASSLQGQPRSTHDLDLIVRLDESLIPPLIDSFPAPAYYLSEVSVALHVCELQWDVLDQDYLRKWSQTLGVEEGWQQILALLEKH